MVEAESLSNVHVTVGNVHVLDDINCMFGSVVCVFQGMSIFHQTVSKAMPSSNRSM